MASDSSLKSYEKCWNSCNASYIASGLAVGMIKKVEIESMKAFLRELLGKAKKRVSLVCTEADIQLMADAVCFHSKNGGCGYYSCAKPIGLPPFVNKSKTEFPAPPNLLRLIGERKLTAECMEKQPG